MSPTTLRSGLILAALLLCADTAALTADEPEPILDAHGDPLPPGALLRLGTTRFRHNQEVHTVAFLPDSKVLLSVSGDGTIRLWEATTGKELRRFENTPPWGDAAALSADGSTVAVSS